MPFNNQQKNQHLLWRAGFGPAVEQLTELKSFSPQEYYDALVKASAKKPQYIDVVSPSLIDLYESTMDARRRSQLTPEDRRILNRQQQTAIKDLNLTWLKEMIATPAQLREKMAFFWHGHFASRNNNIFYNQLLLQTIRENALGNFKTLLRAVSRSASMLYFLNNQQNRKGHPNENFAREVMELFTLGRGNYNENDVKEAARAFTGWSANNRGEFVFRKNNHDDGVKNVLGKNGDFDGDEVLDIILEKPQTAKFITQKIYRFFVNEKIDEKITNDLAGQFYKSGYDISRLMRSIFTSDWFYNEKNMGARIKSPVELLAGIQRMVPMQLDNDNALLNLQKILGQQLLYPPNVAGWPGGKAWIDSSTLMMRLRIPQLFTDKDVLNVKPKQDDDQMMGRKQDGTASTPDNTTALAGSVKSKKKVAGQINAQIDWPQYVAKFEQVKKEDLGSQIAGYLFQVQPQGVNNYLNRYIDASSREAFIRTTTVQLMSTPEYQLC